MTEAPESIVKYLADYLKSKVTSLQQVTSNWPSPSENLQLPCATILAGEPAFTQQHPYIVSKGTKKDQKTKKYPIFVAVGSYDFVLKLHLWADSKPAREKLYQDVLIAMNPSLTVSGLRLQLANYYNEWATYDMEKITYVDSEEQSQRSERRIVVNVLVNVRAIIERADYLIENIENTLSTPDSIPDTSNGGSGNQII